MSCALGHQMKSYCKSLELLWAGRRNNMQVECMKLAQAHHYRVYSDYLEFNVLLECNIFLFAFSGMFSISQMKNRPMILIGG